MKVWIVWDSNLYDDKLSEPMVFDSKQVAIRWSVARITKYFADPLYSSSCVYEALSGFYGKLAKEELGPMPFGDMTLFFWEKEIDS